MGVDACQAVIEPSSPSRFQVYMLLRGRYLELCRRYGLDPRDLSISDLIEIEFERHEDKIDLVKLIVRLCNLEKELEDMLEDMLFPETISEIERSGIIRPART
jgi:hypothetical protein